MLCVQRSDTTSNIYSSFDTTGEEDEDESLPAPDTTRTIPMAIPTVSPTTDESVYSISLISSAIIRSMLPKAVSPTLRDVL